MNEEHWRRLERMYLGAPVNQYFDPGIEIADGRATITILVREDFHHAAGAMHGSVYFKALDDAAFFVANSRVEDVIVLTASFHLDFFRPVSAGTVHAAGALVYEGRRMLTAEAVLKAEGGKVLARGSGTFLRSSLPLDPDIGYK
jgi:uncharacterized protein (TIGR00369 family)